MLIPVVISGGAGTRLWPSSRKSDPKPFMSLPDGESIIGKTYTRCMALNGVTDIVTVTNAAYHHQTFREFSKYSNGRYLSILEPLGRNTAPAIAAAALKVAALYGKDAVILVLPADHLIPDNNEFAKYVAMAEELALADYLVTFGIKPNSPETGYGYIQKGDSINDNGFKVSRFVEKPDLETANKYLASGDFFWNSGMFCFKASKFLNELKRCSEDIYNRMQSCWSSSKVIDDLVYLDEKIFAEVRSDSIDYAVMEKSECVAVIASDFEWNDIGSWDAFEDIYPIDSSNNAVSGDVIAVNSSNCIVSSPNKLTAIVGIKDVVVVTEDDAVLVSHKNSTQDVKKVTETLREKQRAEADLKRETSRPWGSFETIVDAEGYKVKRINVFPGQSLSLQKHVHRSEHWTVVKGKAKVTVNDQEKTMTIDDSIHIPVEAVHRLTNTGEELLTIIEVQCGDYLGEDDIVRLQDNYGRC
ncbi:MAG: mannose-1-phosphate guanylyltransferase/mannose-6-phosphate isomerase [Gammaproteobacteria bacterium]|nr:MAG: mannose-1-phosphate guanylyltransferase/mannose-6-phosphate isomerase [Gammaproteobacteria bacterium]